MVRATAHNPRVERDGLRRPLTRKTVGRCGGVRTNAKHDPREARFITFGQSAEGRLLVVSHVEIADDQIRIISARKATKREIHGYEEQE